jgi:hypothetical protein
VAQRYPTKFGPQPIRDAVHRAGITYSDFILQMGIRPLNHTRLAMNGHCPPSEELRHRASYVLGIPVEELFTAKALAAVRQPGKVKGPKPKASAR